MMSSFIMTLSLFKAPSSGGAFPAKFVMLQFSYPAEIVTLQHYLTWLSFRPEYSLSLTREQNSFLCDYCVTTRKEYLLAGSQTAKPAD